VDDSPRNTQRREPAIQINKGGLSQRRGAAKDRRESQGCNKDIGHKKQKKGTTKKRPFASSVILLL
jgi:hypothetical protein